MRAIVLVPIALVACRPGGDAETDTDTDAPIAALEVCGVTPAPDLDAAEDVVEVELTAAMAGWDPGTGVEAMGMAFNGTVPGPLIEATLGQTLRVRFTNDIDMPLTIHWHGLRVPEAMDGVSQMEDPVQPGETFTYEYTLKDSGFYWYHPHMDTALTLEAGLYAGIIVRDPDEPSPGCDLPIVLDDVLLDDDDGQIEPPGTTMDQVMGRLGNHLLANGRQGREIGVVAGDTVLMRLVVASNARYWDVGFDGVPLTVVGTDDGWLEEPYPADRVTMAPGERYLVTFTAPAVVGESLVLKNRRVRLHDEDHADMMELDPMGDGENPVLTFTAIEGTPARAWNQPAVDIPTLAAGVPAHTWVLEEDMMAGTVTIDGQSWPNVPMVTCPGDTVTIFVVDNRSEMRHPFHIHGNRFQVLDIGGVPTTRDAWKDTFDIPAMTAITIASELDNPGEWMYHCHILEHGDKGMAGMMMVE